MLIYRLIQTRMTLIIYLRTNLRLNPDGAFLNPLIAWKTPPPIHPIANAPPQSSTIL